MIKFGSGLALGLFLLASGVEGYVSKMSTQVMAVVMPSAVAHAVVQEPLTCTPRN